MPKNFKKIGLIFFLKKNRTEYSIKMMKSDLRFLLTSNCSLASPMLERIPAKMMKPMQAINAIVKRFDGHERLAFMCLSMFLNGGRSSSSKGVVDLDAFSLAGVRVSSPSSTF